jgi:hypothetical protein
VSVLSWLLSHPAEVVAAVVAVANLANRAMRKRRGWRGSAADKAHLALDVVSLFGRADHAAGGALRLKFPGTRSR